MTYEQYIQSADFVWQYVIPGYTIGYAGKISNLGVVRLSATQCRVSYTAEMVSRGGDEHSKWYCSYNNEVADLISDAAWHGQIEREYAYTNSFGHNFNVGPEAGSFTFPLQEWMIDGQGRTAHSNVKNFTVSYPAWTSYAIKYSANGGSSTPASQTKYKDIDLTLNAGIAHAEGSAAGYTVTFNGNGGTTSKSSVTSTRTVTYSFAGWKSSYDSAIYGGGGTYKINASTTMTAQWSLSYANNSISLASASRSGYAFDGWYTAASGGTKIGNAAASYTPSANITLYAHWIPLASTITSAGNVTLTVSGSNNCSVTWTPYDANLKFKLKFSIGSWSYTTDFISPNRITAYTYTGYSIPITCLTTAQSGTMAAALYTYNGDGTQLGNASTKTFKVTVASSAVPVISSVAHNETVSTGFSVLVKTLSKIKFTITAGGIGGSTIASANVTFDGITKSCTIGRSGSVYTCVCTSDILRSSGMLSAYITIMDSRGRTASAEYLVSVTDYAEPNAAIDVKVGYGFADVVVTGSISAVNNENDRHLSIYAYKDADDTSAPAGSIDVPLTSYSIDMTGNPWHYEDLDLNTHTFLFRAVVTDKIHTVAKDNAITADKMTGEICISRLAGGKGVAFFGEADQEGFVTWADRTKVDRTISASDWTALTAWYNAH